jgi:rare lipoprotein A
LLIKRLFIATTIVLLSSGCSSVNSLIDIFPKKYELTKDQERRIGQYPKSSGKRVHPTMRPYKVFGRWYYPTVVNVGETFDGVASWYGPNFNGKKTSNGETYDMYKMTAAHKTLPMNTIVRVYNKSNGKTVVVRISDRGPFVKERIIDLSKSAAYAIDMHTKGTAPVKITILGFEQDKKAVRASKKIKEEVLGNFFIQIGSFRSLEGARMFKNDNDNYKNRYHTKVKITEDSHGDKLYKVWLGGFRSDQEARDFIQNNSRFMGAFVTRE